jgi:hypothetical protein
MSPTRREQRLVIPWILEELVSPNGTGHIACAKAISRQSAGRCVISQTARISGASAETELWRALPLLPADHHCSEGEVSVGAVASALWRSSSGWFLLSAAIDHVSGAWSTSNTWIRFPPELGANRARAVLSVICISSSTPFSDLKTPCLANSTTWRL